MSIAKNNYRMAVEFLLGRIEDLMEDIQENGDFDVYKDNIKAINKSIEVVKKYEEM